MSTHGRPAVSAIVLTYNQARYVEECLERLAAQTFTDWELIVADDASVDGALEVARSWCDRNAVPMVAVVHDRNQGLCAILNEAVRRSTGRYIAIAAADDYWLPEKFERQVEVLDSQPDVAVVYSDMAYMDDAGVRDTERLWRTAGTSGRLFEEMLSGTVLGAATALIRRSALLEVGGFDESLVFEDWDPWLRLADRYSFAYSPYVSAVYRERPDSMSSGSDFRVEILHSSVRLLGKWTGRSRREDALIGQTLSRLGWRLLPHDQRAGRRVLSRALRLAPSRVTLSRAVRGLVMPPRGDTRSR